MGVSLKVKAGKLKLNSPIVMVSGTFGYGTEKFDFIDYKKIGAITTKTITYEKWKGNPQPRISEIPCGMINSIGLQNPGVSYFCEKIYPSLEKLKKKGIKIFVSITD
ncbi:dihydroorotate dehydrogenase, partial [bacterium]|nr:dihydroorotate dehydrogenase [bacterium]